MNKLSTYNACTSSCPEFTGCALHATYKYLSSVISQGLNSHHSFWFFLSPPCSFFLHPKPSLLLPWQPKWVSLRILSLTMGTCLPTRTLLYISQTGFQGLSFKFTIKWCWNWNSGGKILMEFGQGPKNSQIFLSLKSSKELCALMTRQGIGMLFLLTGASHPNPSFSKYIQGWWRFL